MYSYRNNKLGLRILICCVVVVIATISPARAADRSRVLTIGLLASGVALKFGSAFVASSAQDTYDQYLFTGIQADIAKYRDNYKSKRDLSVGMSRTGIGICWTCGVNLGFDQLDYISKPSLSLKPSYNPRIGEAALTLQRRF